MMAPATSSVGGIEQVTDIADHPDPAWTVLLVGGGGSTVAGPALATLLARGA